MAALVHSAVALFAVVSGLLSSPCVADNASVPIIIWHGMGKSTILCAKRSLFLQAFCCCHLAQQFTDILCGLAKN